MANVMHRFVYNKFSFKFRDHFAHSLEVCKYKTCNLSKSSLFLPCF